MPARPTTDIIASLRAALAELEHSLGTDEDITPKLRQALAVGVESREEPKTHEDIRAASRTYAASSQDDTSGRPQFDHPKHLTDYTPADDPQWDDAVFMGTGDRYDPTR